jgi:hypothetical protein
MKPGREHFFKYMTADVAKMVLENGTVRYAAPETLNDPFDAQFDLHFGFTPEEAAAATHARIMELVTSKNPVPSPADGNPLPVLLEMLRRGIQLGRLSIDDVSEEMRAAGQEGSKTLERNTKILQAGIRDLWQKDVKVFCVSEVCDHQLMWAHYARDHRGVAIKFLCDEELNNALCIAKPIKYVERPPTLATLDEFVQAHLFGPPLGPRDTWDKVFYSKHTDWSYEREWRVVLSGVTPGEPHYLMKLHPREIGAVIFGSKCTEADRTAISALVKQKYPHCELKQAVLDARTYKIGVEHYG